MKTLKIIIVIIAVIINSGLFANTFTLGEQVYQKEGNEWYNYSSGVKGDQMYLYRMIVRTQNRSAPTENDFTNLNIQGVNLNPRSLLGNYYIIEINTNEDPINIAQTIYGSSIFDYVEFDALGTYSFTPNDIYFSDQWNLHDDKIQAEKAWDITTGNPDVIIGNIDSGADIRHIDLAENIWHNLGEDYDGDGQVFELINGVWEFDPDDINGVDDDENGYIDDFVGWDFRFDENDPTGTFYHGTAVGGIISARTNNLIGVSGITGGLEPNKGVSMMSVRIDDDDGTELFAISTGECITYAVQNGVDVINMSWGWFNDYQYYEDLVNEASDEYNCVLVACTHNDGAGLRYPALYENTIAVGATDENDIVYNYSNYGVGIDVVAPSHVPSTGLNNNYVNFTGTSAATPHVSAIAGLIKSVHANIYWENVRSVIRLSADKVPAMDGQDFDIEYGYGRVNAYEAVLMAQYMAENNITALRTGEVLGAVTENTLLAGNINLVGNLDVQNGADLHIYKRTEIKFTNTNFILMNGGDLFIDGTAEERVNFTSGLENPIPGSWYGIIIESGNLEMNYCDISYANVGVQFNGAGTGVIQNSHIFNCNTGIEYVPSLFITPNSSFSVETSSISGCDIGIHGFGGNIAIAENYLIGDNKTGVLIEQSRSYKITGNDIVLNSKAGLVVRNSSGGTIAGNVISGNGNEAEWQTDRITGGIFLHASSPTITNNIIQNNKLHGITEMNGSRPILNYRERALNQINNNGDPYDPSVFDAEIRWYDRSIPYLDYGHNDIMDDDGGYLIYGNYSPFNPVIRVRHNYWADTDPGLFNRFYPIGAYVYRPYDTEPNGTPPNGFFADAPALFDQGLQYEEDEDWDNAISTYHSIITTYPESKEASGSVIRLYAITKITDGDFQALQDYYTLLLTSFPETLLAKTAEQYAILCDVALQDYAIAVGKYETILQNPPSLEDSVYAVIDIGQVYLASSVAGGNGLGRKAAIGTMPEYQPDDFADYEEKVNHALSAMMGKIVVSQSGVLPMDFALYSNYPNPFNPITNIKIDIPENSHIKLTIFDLSGRVVAELMNQNITAGTHKAIWNGKDNKGRQVSSGVYLYTITAKSNKTANIFTQSNKMVLLK